MRGIADSLNVAGQVISDEDLVLYILGRFGSEFVPVAVNPTSRQDALSLSEAQFILQCFEMRLEALATTSTVDLFNASVNVAVSNNNKKNFKN